MASHPRRRTSSLVLLRRGRRAPPDHPRPRRARPAGGGVATADSQTLLIRRVVAGRRHRARPAAADLLRRLRAATASARTRCKDYNRAALDDRHRVGPAGERAVLPAAHGGRRQLAAGPPDRRSPATACRPSSSTSRPAELDVPGDMRGAQQSALIALELRRDGLDRIAQEIRPALGDEGEQADAAIEQIAGQMQAFLASDVAWDTRVIPFIKNALDEHEIGGQEISRSQFLTDLELGRSRRRSRPCSTSSSRAASGRRTAASRPARACTASGLDSTSTATPRSSPSVSNRLTYVPGTGVHRERSPTRARTTSSTSRSRCGSQAEGRRPDHDVEDDPEGRARARARPSSCRSTDQPPLDTAVTIRVSVAQRSRRGEDRQQPRRVPALFARG